MITPPHPLSYNSVLRVPRSYHRAWVPQGQNTQIVLFGGDSSEAMNTADVVGGPFHPQSHFWFSFQGVEPSNCETVHSMHAPSVFHLLSSSLVEVMTHPTSIMQLTGLLFPKTKLWFLSLKPNTPSQTLLGCTFTIIMSDI